MTTKKENFDVPVSLRIPEELNATLLNIAMKQECPKSEVLLYFLRKGMKEEGTIIESSAFAKEYEEENLKLLYTQTIEELEGKIEDLQEVIVDSIILDSDCVAVLNLLADKLNKSRIEIIKIYLFRYNIEQQADILHKFVLSNSDIENATGKNVNELLNQLK